MLWSALPTTLSSVRISGAITIVVCLAGLCNLKSELNIVMSSNGPSRCDLFFLLLYDSAAHTRKLIRIYCRYDREFLMQFTFICTEKPDHMVHAAEIRLELELEERPRRVPLRRGSRRSQWGNSNVALLTPSVSNLFEDALAHPIPCTPKNARFNLFTSPVTRL